ncbi:2-dehydro-3-deoxygalactonokinase [Wenxinia marina]|uniref:2-keto-3-deoxy-galactonokinase n=1 Tax=Wenxinia marina DSM 24838 TaxID=1123501 RepID=A0A0D0Q829_9RHOB|nr:2-dehydro-3-deoxygalactonokinase [Wenxinia marina]KIQ70579.1 2-keto-3-deoxy-galactonokinase [Wenxinia marina DSM 24838]GGL51993.1 2-keto-3-deoxy-galactonokinase [Wenxinia marina]
MTDGVPDWLAVDWGTSNLRVWAMTGDGRALGLRTSDRGMGRLAPEQFEEALKECAGDWIAGPVTAIACGMVGARQGWIEAPYIAVPAAPLGDRPVRAPTRTPGLSVHILPGMSQDRPADVMRGEETQIAGFLARSPGWDGVMCLPGSHTKWVQVSAGEVVSFQTYMTGELFAALSGHTVLRHSVGGDGWDDAAFAEAVEDARAAPERLAARLFPLRAEGLLHGQTAAVARARLSGLLIGAELAAARPYWLGQRVGLIGEGTLAGRYRAALEAQGVPVETADADAVTLAGLAAAWAGIRERA